MANDNCIVCGRNKILRSIKILESDINVCQNARSCQNFLATQIETKRLENIVAEKN